MEEIWQPGVECVKNLKKNILLHPYAGILLILQHLTASVMERELDWLKPIYQLRIEAEKINI